MKFPWSTSIVDVLKNESKLEEKQEHIVKGNKIANFGFRHKLTYFFVLI
jgi:hypothetical protein